MGDLRNYRDEENYESKMNPQDILEKLITKETTIEDEEKKNETLELTKQQCQIQPYDVEKHNRKNAIALRTTVETACTRVRIRNKCIRYCSPEEAIL